MSTQATFPAVAQSGRQWSKYQTAIFEDFATGTGHTVIEACAGSGKTSTIIEGLKHLPPGKKTLMLAFNRSTAAELKSRVPPGVDAKTSHGLGYGAIMWAWRSQFPKIDVDEKRELKLSKQLVPQWKDEDRDALLKTVAFAKAWVVSSDKHLNGLIREYDIRPASVSQAELVRRAQELLLMCQQPSEVVSFDDMIWLPVALNMRPKQYDVVIGDEAQDNSRAQIELAMMAMRRGGRMIFCGDTRQALYAFRGADSRSMPNLIKRLDAKTLPLSVTYRCPKAVVAYVQDIVPQLEAAPNAKDGSVTEGVTPKTMVDGWQPGDFVLSRVNAPLVRLCLRALRNGHPAYVLGRDVGAGLRSLVGRYKGGESISGLIEYLREWRDEETKRLKAAEKESQIDAVVDRFETVVALSEDSGTVSELLARMETLFSDETGGRRIMFASTHKAKGLEAKRVWILAPTYRRGASEEEDNLWYVGCTRTIDQLMVVEYSQGQML